MDVPAARPAFQARRALAWLTGFTLTNAVAAIAIAALNIPFGHLAEHWKAALFLTLALPGHFLFFGALLGLPPLLLGWLTRRNGALTAAAVILQAAWICLLVTDAKVFALYRFHLNAMVANMVFGGAMQDQVVFSAGTWALIALAVALVLALEIAAAWLWWRALRRRPGLTAIVRAWWLAAAVMLFGQAMVAYYDARGDRAVLSQLPYIPWAQPITLKDSLQRFGVKSDPDARMPSAGEGLLQYPRKPLECDKAPKLNVVVILLESLRHDALNPQVMPNTWRLAQRSQWYDDHYSSGNATRFGLFGLLYGLPGGYWHPMLAEQRGSAFIGQMKKDGYAMHIYGSAPLYNPEFDRTVFSEVRERLVNGPRERHSAERDLSILRDLQRDIAATPAQQRFFGFVFLDSTHQPYYMSEGYPPLFQPMAKSINPIDFGPDHDPLPDFNRYRTAAHYADSLIGPFLDALQAGPFAHNTVVVVTGDHGEEFNDLKQNYWGHNGNFSDYQLRTPFVLYWPGMAARKTGHVTSHEDLVPTLMKHALGCRNDSADYSTGRDLFGPAQPNRPLLVESWSQRGIRQGDRIYLFDNYGAATVVDRRYRPIPGAKVDPAAVSQSWEMLTRFQQR
ncbi:DUF3413 domain-containing protein [Lysobacter enzymogenes]|uniref:Sulfatase n=1 Tax=Lysobacter enzymogenes TaxID=69 RepID=A0A0S2DGG9_LYSEN|nr:sulfatase-like hydrolase/transferase [Lysobacter enzymogenes]ALN57502.1 sulfatase [Lysobacter enzymogenes]QCW26097.1 DUF3413 domain-containing protein [Lysobacter enzymogenes]QQP99334.1 DUF3413 domain-containing protein [Lysobacter enzymogenes]